MEVKRFSWIAFAALCLLSGSAWMIDQFYTEILSGPIHTAVHEGSLAVIFAALSLRSHKLLSSRLYLELALCGIVLFALPTILSAASGGSIGSLTIILIATFIPTVVVFLTAQTSVDDNPMRLLLPALAGLGGAALLLPFYWPPTVSGDAWLIAMIVSAVLSAFAAIRLHRILQQSGLFSALAILCAFAAISSALCFQLGSVSSDWTRAQLLIELLRCLCLEGPILFLLVYLLRELNPIAISARYLLVPLVTIVESYLIERPHTEWTTFAGVLFMAASAAILIRTSLPDKSL